MMSLANSANLWILWTAAALDTVLAVAAALLCIMAAAHCAGQTKPVQFQRAGRRTKTFWLACTVTSAVLTAFGAISSVSALVGLGLGVVGLGSSLFVTLIAATVCGVYLADVKPAVSIESSGPSAW